MPSEVSLMDKLKAHYRSGPKKPKLGSWLSPDSIAKIALPEFLFTVVSAYYLGIFIVIPLLYESRDNAIFFNRCFIHLLIFEVMSNWCGIRYVESTYSSYRKLMGDPPATLSKAPISSTKPQVNGHTSSVKCCPEVPKPEEIERDAKMDLASEAFSANREMRVQKQKNGIEDLLSSCKDENEHKDPEKSLSSTDSSKESTIFTPKPTVQKQGGQVVEKYPYWSWVPCYLCKHTRPPRCHHCPVCQSCVLKRDHHCFFAGNCVGYRNQRYFYVFLIWAWVSCIYATLNAFPFIYYFLWADMAYIDVIAPVTIVRFVLGYVSFQATLVIVTLTCVFYFIALTCTFIYTQTILVLEGMTSFEKAFLKKNLVISDSRKTNSKIQAVFGKFWFANLFFPLYFTEPVEDPANWPSVTVTK